MMLLKKDENVHAISVKVPSSQGYTMAATLDLPDTAPRAYAIFAHCFTCSRFAPAAARVSKALAEQGIACLRFDFPGLGQSEGNFHETSFSENVADIRAASRWLEQHYSAPQLLVGHSLGGAAALQAAVEMPTLKAVATIGAPFDPAHAVLHFADRIGEIDEKGEVPISLGGRDIIMSRHYLEDLAETNPEAYLPKLRKPLLILHSPIDQTVGVENAQNIFLTTRYPKSLVSLDKVDHLLTKPGAGQQAADIIVAWFEQHIVPENTEALAESIPEGVAIATSTKAGRFTDVVRTGTHVIGTDREAYNGGKNLGIAPTSLLVSGLAAATSQAVREAAQQHRIRELVDVKVSVAKTVGDHLLHLRRSIELIGDLSDQQRQVLLAAAKSSVIEAMFAQPVVIEDTSY